MDIKVDVIKPKEKNKTYTITHLLQKVSWEGDYKSSARKLEFTYVTSTLDVNLPKFDLPVGSTVVFYEKGKELFKGMAYSRKLDGDTVTVVCYDDGARLLKIKGAYNFSNRSATDIVNKICADYGIPKGDIVAGTNKITKVFINTSLYDIIMTAYSEVSKSTKKKYMCVFKNGKLNVVEKGVTQLSISFEEFKNITSNTFSESVENMVNKVVVVDDTGAKVSEHSRAQDIELYGTFQEVIRKNKDKDITAEVNNTYKEIEQTCSLKGYGNTTCTVGNVVKVKDSNTKMVGLFYIDADRHTWEKGDYSIELSLNFKNIMNEVSAGQEESDTSTTVSSSGSSSSSSGTTTKPSTGSVTAGGTSKVDKMITLAKSKLGNQYVWGATGPSKFDCSGFTQWLHKQVGISIPRTSSAQGHSGYFVAQHNLKPGDLVFFITRGSDISHVGLYVGNNKMIHASSPTGGVRYDEITNPYYQKRFTCGRRYV